MKTHTTSRPSTHLTPRQAVLSNLPQRTCSQRTTAPHTHAAPSLNPGTCTIVSRFCRDVETELITEEGPMVTTLIWWEGGGGGAGTITVGWWVGAGGGRSCKAEALNLSPKFPGASTSLPYKTISLCPLPQDCLCQLLMGGTASLGSPSPSYFKKEMAA